ncbi:MAG: hypothetical protein ACYCZN_02120 [Candidatus Dormibacteria bacterium]
MAAELLGFQDQRTTGRYRFSSLVGEGEVTVLFGSVVEASYARLSGAAAIGAMLDAPPGKVEWLEAFEMPHLGPPLPESLSELVDQWRQNRDDVAADAVESPRAEATEGAADSATASSREQSGDSDRGTDAVGSAPTSPLSVEAGIEDPWGASVPTPDVVGTLDFEDVPTLAGPMENGGGTSHDADSIVAPPLDEFDEAPASPQEQSDDEKEAVPALPSGLGWDADTEAIIAAPDILGMDEVFDSGKETSGESPESISAPAEDPFAETFGELETAHPADGPVGKYTALHEASDPEGVY